MTEMLTMESFASLTNRDFIVEVTEGQSVHMELIEVNDLSERTGSGRTDQTPFSLTFRGPQHPVYQQQTYRFEHAELGTHDIFIVPVGRSPEGLLYEAVFT